MISEPANPVEVAEAWASALRHLPQRYEARVPLDRLREHPENPRKGNMRALDESVDTLGFYGVLYVQEGTGYVLAGNHRLKKLRAAGVPWVDVVWLTVDEVTARKILLADNRVGDLGAYDNTALSRLLDDIASTSDAGLRGTAYTEQDREMMNNLTRELAAAQRLADGPGDPVVDPAGEWGGMPSLNAQDLSPYRTIIVHFTTPEDVTAFATLIGQPVSERTRSLWYPAQAQDIVKNLAYASAEAPAPAISDDEFAALEAAVQAELRNVQSAPEA